MVWRLRNTGGGSDVSGATSGANVWAALERARELGPGKTVVSVIVDSGLRYLNGDLFRNA
jgi:cysteine synthase A